MSPRALASEPAVVSPYLNAAEAAHYLRYASAGALYKAIRYGVKNGRGERIPVINRGRTLLFQRDALDAWLHGNSVDARSSVVKLQSISRQRASREDVR